jgi:hypothetical protein
MPCCLVSETAYTLIERNKKQRVRLPYRALTFYTQKNMPLSAKFKITYSKSNAAIHKVVKLLAKQAFMYSDDLQGFINGVKYDVTAWGESHAKRKQTLASVHYEATENTKYL